ncbi:MAG: carboxypeptidase regulatory-like domain-containing protein [Acidobacteria bacterium]|nr:carboxypeptidase regulatory-like domain-containing protein [Acidobacteriota bacterium]
MTRSILSLSIARAGIAVFAAAALAGLSACRTGGTVRIDDDDIGGVVSGPDGPEAGVWVIAETHDLPTRFARIVVTDDRGRYLLPDLPSASYDVWVRGYGLIDSPKAQANPGARLDLTAVIAPDEQAAAQYYPAGYWLSLLKVPEQSEFPGTGPDGNGLSTSLQNQAQLLRLLKSGSCTACHQLGTKATREIPPALGHIENSVAAWERRLQSGQAGRSMIGLVNFLGTEPILAMFADWTDRIAAGEVPTQTPPRPTGIERNVVVTLWDWGTETDGRTDSAASDVRDATVNANGLIYGVVQPSDILAVLDPVEHRASVIKIPSNGPEIQTDTPVSPYWGDDPVWARQSDPRSVALDGDGRVWFTGRVRGADAQPGFCTDASNAFADYYPLARGSRQVFMYDPRTEVFSEIDTCFSADHNQISDDDVIYYGFNGGLGWIDIDIWDETQDAEAAQGWCPGVLDTNGDGVITRGWTEPSDAIDPTLDHRIQVSCYSPAVNPADGTVWCSGNGPRDNKLVRIEIGDNPPASCTAEVFEPPPSVTSPSAYGSGGLHFTADGVAWQDWRGSGHFASFDRSQCADTTDLEATGQSCPEGWTFHRIEKPTYQNAAFPINSDESYLTQIDHHDVLGLGRDVPLYGVVNTDSLEVFIPDTGQFVTLRVPYPMGFFSRSSNGRIDDPTTGWKGKGLWSSYSNYAAWHLEGGAGTKQKSVKFQIRPDPLAK